MIKGAFELLFQFEICLSVLGVFPLLNQAIGLAQLRNFLSYRVVDVISIDINERDLSNLPLIYVRTLSLEDWHS